MKMSELKKSDPKMYDAMKAKKLAKREVKRNALAKLIEFANAKGDDAIKAIAKSLTSATREAGPRSPNFLTVLKEMFATSPMITEDQVWAKYRLGRSDMRKYTVNAIKKLAPADRLWISFNMEGGKYTLEGKGAAIPANWKGYRPLIVDGAEVK